MPQRCCQHTRGCASDTCVKMFASLGRVCLLACRPRLEKTQERRRGYQRGRLVCNRKGPQAYASFVRVLCSTSGVKVHIAPPHSRTHAHAHTRTHAQDTTGDKMTKGGQKLVAYPDSNLANNRLRQSYGKSSVASAHDSSGGTNMGSPAPSHGAARGEAGAGGEATPASSRVRAGSMRSARKGGGKKGGSRAAEPGSLKFRDLGGVDKLLQVSSLSLSGPNPIDPEIPWHFART